jgi:hypothetical protein
MAAEDRMNPIHEMKRVLAAAKSRNTELANDLAHDWQERYAICCDAGVSQISAMRIATDQIKKTFAESVQGG